jgi:hypothetical protein
MADNGYKNWDIDPHDFLADLKKKADEAEAQAAKEREEKYFRFTILASQLNRMSMRRIDVLKMFLKGTSALVSVQIY